MSITKNLAHALTVCTRALLSPPPQKGPEYEANVPKPLVIAEVRTTNTVKLLANLWQTTWQSCDVWQGRVTSVDS